MRVVGTLFVLAACAAIQLPWFSCHSDCQQAFLPMWDLGVHRCHDEAAHATGPRACACCPTEDAGADRPSEHGLRTMDPDHDHGPGDHELQPRSSRRPASVETPTPAWGLAPFALLPPTEVDASAPATCAWPQPGVFDTGPPDRLASIRLLL